MQFVAELEYPDDEKPQLAELESLFREWHAAFKEHADDMVFDGFYPHYFSQKKRILFIGRESLKLAGLNYLNVLYPCYRVDKRVDRQPLNKHKFHSRMMRIAYGIVHARMPWPGIPYASYVADTFGIATGLSFAFMNISKLSNESGNWQADWDLIHKSCRLSTQGRNFIQEEVSLLKPDIIITMCLSDEISALGKLVTIDSTPQVTSFWLDSNGHRSLLINTWHFSAPRKKAERDYYVPICDAIGRSEAAAGIEPG